jgi:hypothetical protein
MALAFTITTTASSSASPAPPPPGIPSSLRLLTGWFWLWAGILVVAAFAGLRLERRRLRVVAFASALLTFALWAACGGGGGGGGGGSPLTVPIANLSSANLTFSGSMGWTSAVQNVVLSNPGTGLLSISNIGLTGTNPGDFAQTNNCGASVAVGANCTIGLTFKPTVATGTRSASLVLNDNAGGSPQTAALSGTVTQPSPSVSLSATSLVFAPQGYNTTSAPHSVTVTNTGPAALSISGVYVTGQGVSDFFQSNACGSSLGSGASCSINVTFSPVGTGGYSASLEIIDNASDSPQTVSLAGSGVTPATPPGTYNFVVSGTGYSSHAQAFSVTVQ